MLICDIYIRIKVKSRQFYRHYWRCFNVKKGENIYKRKDGRWEGRYILDSNTKNMGMFMEKAIQKQKINFQLLSQKSY